MSHHSSSRRMSAMYLAQDADEFSDSYDPSAIPIGSDMSGHDIPLLGPKTVLLDTFIIDLQTVDTSAQTFRLKLLVNIDWEDDGAIEPEVKSKRSNLSGSTSSARSLSSSNNSGGNEVYKTGKYVLKPDYRNSSDETSCWDPQIVLVNAISDDTPIEITPSVQLLNGRPIISKSVLYQPECRCAFSYANFPFDETDLVVKLSSNTWNSEQVHFVWSHRLQRSSSSSSSSATISSSLGRTHNNTYNNNNKSNNLNNRRGSVLTKSVDTDAVGGVGLSEFEIVNIRVSTTTKVMHNMSRYDNAEGITCEAHLIIHVRRDPYSYLLRVASVAELLMLLEVVSFLVHDDDMADRFSISGTIFLAMVSLYGPMSDCLPKVSVVTRVDRWQLNNFFLLFASNVENLVMCLVRKYIDMDNTTVDTQFYNFIETILAGLYLYCVIKNLFWFVQPLKEREDYALLLDWFEERIAFVFQPAAILEISLSWIPWNKKLVHDNGKHDSKSVWFQNDKAIDDVKAD